MIPPFEEIDIKSLLPQQPPFVMVDALLDYSEEKTVTALKVQEENIFCSNGTLSASGMMENIAQTCAARLGYINKYILKNNRILVGYIGAINNLTILREPRVGEVIATTVQVLEQIMGMTLIQGTIKAGDEVLAEGTMKIAIAE